MQTNNSCSGLCFWGIKPGVTYFDEAIRFLKRIDSRPYKETNGQYEDSYQYKENKVAVSLAIYGSNGRVQNLGATVIGVELLGVTGKDWLAFRPDHFLKPYGAPKRVNIVMSEGPEGRVSYGMVLFYDQMYIRYSGNQITIKPQAILSACPNRDHNIKRFDLWLGQYDEKIWNDGVELSRMSPLTVDQFYQILVGVPEKACFALDYNRFLSPAY